MTKIPASVKKVLSGEVQKPDTYENAVYDTERHVTDETDSLWQAAEKAVWAGDYLTVVNMLRCLWTIKGEK